MIGGPSTTVAQGYLDERINGLAVFTSRWNLAGKATYKSKGPAWRMGLVELTKTAIVERTSRSPMESTNMAAMRREIPDKRLATTLAMPLHLLLFPPKQLVEMRNHSVSTVNTTAPKFSGVVPASKNRGTDQRREVCD